MLKKLNSFKSKLTHIMSEMDHVTQHIIDTLYTDMKTIFNSSPLKSRVCINNIHLILVIILKRTRRHDKKHGLMMNVRYYVRNVC